MTLDFDIWTKNLSGKPYAPFGWFSYVGIRRNPIWKLEGEERKGYETLFSFNGESWKIPSLGGD